MVAWYDSILLPQIYTLEYWTRIYHYLLFPPDPNSLQGKILRLLDDDGQMNKFPHTGRISTSFREISTVGQPPSSNPPKVRIGREKKSGVRNRYCLTREKLCSYLRLLNYDSVDGFKAITYVDYSPRRGEEVF